MRERASLCKRALAVVTLSILVAACEAPPPSGQVVANIDRTTVTMRELAQERGATAIGQEDALDQLVTRRILANEAKARGLEQDGDYHFALRAMRERLLVDALQRDLNRSLPPVTADQIATRQAQQPWRYARRFQLDLAPTDTTSDEVRASLDSGSLVDRPSTEILNARTGSEITLDGQSWRVVRRTPITIDTEMLNRAVRAQIVQERTTDVMRRMVANYRQTGKIRYQQGFGPSGR